ncbi:MAG: hypothetical protein GXY55_04295 [Phycisphaerae bacterium]|jgi:hypothetical protein|nr:hypothetical protein [Phycisphaerae bacterium]
MPLPSDEELSAYPIEMVDRIDQEVLHWLEISTEDWSAVDTDSLSKSRAVALRLLVWSGLLELRLQLLVWAGGTSQCARAAAVVSGRFESVLPEAVSRVLPGFDKHVRVQPQTTFGYRLTLDGVQARADAADANGVNRIMVLAASKRVLSGRASVRVLDVNATVGPLAAAAAARAEARVGDIHVVVNMPPAQHAEPASPTSNQEATSDDDRSQDDSAPDGPVQRCGNWDKDRVAEGITRHIEQNWDRYIALGRDCLVGKKGAKKALAKAFGPTAIAERLNKAEKITDPALTCGPTHISGNAVYQDRIKPLRDGEIPEGWPDDEPPVPTMADDIREMIEGAGP